VLNGQTGFRCIYICFNLAYKLFLLFFKQVQNEAKNEESKIESNISTDMPKIMNFLCAVYKPSVSQPVLHYWENVEKVFCVDLDSTRDLSLAEGQREVNGVFVELLVHKTLETPRLDVGFVQLVPDQCDLTPEMVSRSLLLTNPITPILGVTGGGHLVRSRRFIQDNHSEFFSSNANLKKVDGHIYAMGYLKVIEDFVREHTAKYVEENGEDTDVHILCSQLADKHLAAKIPAWVHMPTALRANIPTVKEARAWLVDIHNEMQSVKDKNSTSQLISTTRQSLIDNGVFEAVKSGDLQELSERLKDRLSRLWSCQTWEKARLRLALCVLSAKLNKLLLSVVKMDQDGALLDHETKSGKDAQSGRKRKTPAKKVVKSFLTLKLLLSIVQLPPIFIKHFLSKIKNRELLIPAIVQQIELAKVEITIQKELLEHLEVNILALGDKAEIVAPKTYLDLQKACPQSTQPFHLRHVRDVMVTEKFSKKLKSDRKKLDKHSERLVRIPFYCYL
jgi:hypothetical protein